MSKKAASAITSEITNLANQTNPESITPAMLAQILQDLSDSTININDNANALGICQSAVSMTLAAVYAAIGGGNLNPFQWIYISSGLPNPMYVLATSANTISPVGFSVVSGVPVLVGVNFAANNDGNTNPLLFTVDATGKFWLTQKTGNSNAGLNTILRASAPLSFGSVSGLTCVDQTITVTGAAVGDCVSLGIDVAAMPSAGGEAQMSFIAFVSSTNTVTVRCLNPTSSSFSPSGTFTVTIIK